MPFKSMCVCVDVHAQTSAQVRGRARPRMCVSVCVWGGGGFAGVCAPTCTATGTCTRAWTCACLSLLSLSNLVLAAHSCSRGSNVQLIQLRRQICLRDRSARYAAAFAVHNGCQEVRLCTSDAGSLLNKVGCNSGPQDPATALAVQNRDQPASPHISHPGGWGVGGPLHPRPLYHGDDSCRL